MMWTKHLPAAVAATGLTSLHRRERYLIILTALLGVTTTATGLARLHGRERYLIILTALLGVTTATSTESERAKSLLDNSGDKVGHFCLFNGENAF
jgi:hypothetical protein